jgi:hypothetical protein
MTSSSDDPSAPPSTHLWTSYQISFPHKAPTPDPRVAPLHGEALPGDPSVPLRYPSQCDCPISAIAAVHPEGMDTPVVSVQLEETPWLPEASSCSS